MTLQDTMALDGEVIPPGDGDVRVVAAHHPFKVERTDQQMLAGLTLAEMLERAQPDPVLRRHARIMLGDWEVPRENWHLVRPKPGATVTIRVVPHGGGGGDKNPLRTVLTIAVLAVGAAISGGTLLPAIGGISAATVSAVGGALFTVAGSLAINALIPPSQPQLGDLSGSRTEDSPSLSIRGGRNRANRFGAVPRPYGRHRMYPPLAADYVTEVNGDDQYLRMAVCWGYGPLLIENLRIGETPIEEFADVQVETDPGFSTITSLPFFPDTVDEQQLSIALKQSEGFTTRTTEPDADEIVVDITFPRGLVEFNDRGDKQSRNVQLVTQYAPTGTNNWKGIEVTSSQSAQSIKVIDSEQYYGTREIIRSAGDRIGSRYVSRLIVGVVYIDRYTGQVRKETREGYGGGNPINWIPGNGLAVATFNAQVLGSGVVSSNLTDRRNFGDEASGFAPSLNPGSGNTDTTVSLTSGTVESSVLSVTGRQTNALRRSVRFDVPRGQYDVRLRRVTADSTDNQVFDDVAWTALRTITDEPPITFEQPIAVTGLRIRATDQLNGVIDQLNADVTAILPDWDGSSWVQRPTVNPASAFRDVLTGNANARALATSRLADSDLQEWHDFCEAEGFAYNFPGDTQTSVQRKLADIAQAGRAAPTIRDGKWSVVIDQERTTPVQHFTPRNSWGFEGQKAFPDQPHAWRIRFPNEEEGYEQDERIVYDDGYDETNATKFEGLELAGVTDPAQVYKLGRYHIATARLRPEVYTFNADVEHIVCTRGDLIRVTHDVTLWGLNSGRVKAVQDDGGSPPQATSVTLDETVTMEAGKTYNVRFRLADGSTLVKDVTTVAGDTDTLTFSTPFDLADAPEVGDLFMFGETDTESVELVVKAIEPQGELTAKITAVDHSPAIYQADQGTIPAFDSQITGLEPLPPVTLTSDPRSDESALQRTPTGLIPRIIISVQPVQQDGAFLEAQIKPDNADETWQQAAVQSQSGNTIALTDVDEGESYDIRLRWRTNADARSLQGTGIGPWTLINGYKVVGRTTPPQGLQNLTISALGGMAFLRWDAVPDIDVKFGGRIEFRHSPNTSGVTWGTSTSISRAAQGNATQVQLPLKAGTYFARPFDSAGIPSETVAKVTTKQAQAINFANVSSVTEQTAFSGTKTDVVVDSGSLKLAASQNIDDVAEIDAVTSIDSLGGITADGVYDFAGSIDTGAVGNYRGTSLVEATAINELDLLSERTDPIDSWQSIDGTDAAVSDCWVEVRHTDDDPTGTPTWSDWERLDAAEFNARAFEFRAQLRTDDPSYNIRVDKLEATIDEVPYT